MNPNIPPRTAIHKYSLSSLAMVSVPKKRYLTKNIRKMGSQFNFMSKCYRNIYVECNIRIHLRTHGMKFFTTDDES
jgi:hypothetical protein